MPISSLNRFLGVLALLAVLGSACTQATTPQTASGARASGGESAASTPQKALVVAFSTEPSRLDRGFSSGSGVNDWGAFLSGFLSYTNPDTSASPYLAAELPSLDKGSWTLLPDGGMETTYRLKSGATWHDGAPLTANDFLFAWRVRLDPDLPSENKDVERRITSATAPDEHTLVLRWKELYIWAGQISTPNFAPMPAHLLEEQYNTDKIAMIDIPYWRTEFVGSGPYRLESWQQGSEMTLRAFDGFVLGKPRIERIVVKFIQDANTIVANMLSDTVDIAFHSSIGYSQNQSLEQAGFQGRTEYWQGNPRYIEFQAREWPNTQRAVFDVRVRRALLSAFNRQEIIDGLYAGKTRILHFWLQPDDPSYPRIDPAVTKYPYDRSQAEALLQDAGWVKGGDGMVRNAEGEGLSMPILNQSGEIDQLEAAMLANDWKAVGVSSDITVLNRLQQGDGEFRSKFPAVSFNRTNFDYEAFPWLETKISTAQNRWAGTNRTGYSNPTVNELWPKAMSTLDARAREPLYVDLFKAMTADAVVTPTHLQPRPMAYRVGLVGPKENYGNAGALVWNIWEWHWN